MAEAKVKYSSKHPCSDLFVPVSDLLDPVSYILNLVSDLLNPDSEIWQRFFMFFNLPKYVCFHV